MRGNIEPEKLVLVTVRIFEADLEYLKHRPGVIGYNERIRRIVRAYCQRQRSKEKEEDASAA